MNGISSFSLPLGALDIGGSQQSMWNPRSQESQNNMLSCNRGKLLEPQS